MTTVEEANASGFVLVHGWRTGSERLMQANNIIRIYEDKPSSHKRKAKGRMVTVLDVARGVYCEAAESVSFVLKQIQQANAAIYEGER